MSLPPFSSPSPSPSTHFPFLLPYPRHLTRVSAHITTTPAAVPITTRSLSSVHSLPHFHSFTYPHSSLKNHITTHHTTMRLLTLAFALIGATAITAMPSVGDTAVSYSFESPVSHPNVTLEERGGGGRGGGRDHCKKERGRRPDTCGCYDGLDCHDDRGQCECGDQGNASFDFCGSCRNDEPKCVCKGDHQSEPSTALYSLRDKGQMR